MTKQQMIKEGNKQAYDILVKDIKNYLEEYIEDSVFNYRYFDFTDDMFNFIDKERKKDGNNGIVHDIIDPALDEIREKIMMALKEEN